MKTPNKKHIIISAAMLGVIAALILLLAKGLSIDPTKIPSELIGKPAYPFSAVWIQGQDALKIEDQEFFGLADLKGKPLVLNFWASWCVSCREEARELEAFWQKYKNTDLRVVGIAIQDTINDAKGFANAYGKTYILGLDEDGKIAIDYGVTGVPETFIIDRNGVVIHKEIGPVTVKMLEEYVPRLDIRS